MVSRRRFIAAGIAAGAALGTGGLLMRLAPAAPGANLLSCRELGILEAIAEVMFPGDPMPVDGLDAQVAIHVDLLVAQLLPPARQLAFRYGLRGLEVGTQASRGRRFTQLSTAERAEVLEAWSDPSVVPRRLAYDAMKLFLGMAYFRHPAVVEHIGWRTGCPGGSV